MNKIIISIGIIVMLFTSVPIVLTSEEIAYEEPFDGYILFSQSYYFNTYLINKDAEVVNKWSSLHCVSTVAYLLENGNLIRADYKFSIPSLEEGGFTGRVEIFDWNGTRIWNFVYANIFHNLHHDIKVLPNGNILMIAWEFKTMEQTIDAGLNPKFWYNIFYNTMAVDHIIEVKPTGYNSGDIVWEWHIWDHLIQDYDSLSENYGVVADHPELLNINYNTHRDFNHINSIDYNEELDQILLSSRHQSEIWIIDHSTTTEEAAGHTGGKYGKGGDILYRWGNPQVYNRGDEGDQKLFYQHNARWIKPGCPGEGHITIFNNGVYRPGGEYSSVEEIVLPPLESNGNYYIEPGCNYGPEEPVWSYKADFYSETICSAQRLPNGNTIICDGEKGNFFEINPGKQIVWQYKNNLLFHRVFSIQCYPKDYPGIGAVSSNIIIEKDEIDNNLTTKTQINKQTTQSLNQYNDQQSNINTPTFTGSSTTSK